MTIIKRLILGLLFIFPIVLIFNNPGLPILEVFNQSISHYSVYSLQLLGKYPPLLYLILNSLLKIFPIDKSVYFFFNQDAWIASKYIIYLFYYLTWLSVLFFAKSIKKLDRKNIVDISIIYFASISILLISLGLSYMEIIAAPFLILSLSTLFKKRFAYSFIFFILAVGINLTILIFVPYYIHYFTKQAPIKNKIALLLSNIVSLISIILVIYFYFLPHNFKYISMNQDIFNLPWFLNIFTNKFISDLPGNLIPLVPNILLPAMITGISGLLFFFLLIFPFRSVLLKIWSKSKLRLWLYIFLLVITSIGLMLIKPNFIFFVFIIMFLFLYGLIHRKLTKLINISNTSFLLTLFYSYLAFVFLSPFGLNNSLIWPLVLVVIIYIHNNSQVNKYLLLATNLIISYNLFLYYGSAGYTVVGGNYFSLFKPIFVTLNIIFIAISLIYGLQKKSFALNLQSNLLLEKWLKRFIVVFFVCINLSLITASGTGDVVAFNETALACIKYPNPFQAHAAQTDWYPPLSTVIICTFTQLWKSLVGLSENYKLAIKISIISFYFITLASYLRITSLVGTNKFTSIPNIDKVIAFLTTIGLIIQTQGFSDINIYLIPTMVFSVYFLFKKKYLLSGLFFGITFSIKIQPMIILPLMIVTVFDIRKHKNIIRHSILFLTGFITTCIFFWSLVIIQPGGWNYFQTTVKFISNDSGKQLLSGQALNLNWVVTYLLHIFSSNIFGSLEYWGWVNWQVPGSLAPKIFQGFLFYLATFIIVIRYWFLKKKTILNFLSASVMIFFSHHILNTSAHEKHLFYTIITMLLLYLIKPSNINRKLLTLFDIMMVINLVFFYGIAGPKDFGRLFYHFDLTVPFALFYVVIYFIIFINYLRGKILPTEASPS